jgi:hypothetical protein
MGPQLAMRPLQSRRVSWLPRDRDCQAQEPPRSLPGKFVRQAVRQTWACCAHRNVDSTPSEHMDQAFVSQCDIGERIIVRERCQDNLTARKVP